MDKTFTSISFSFQFVKSFFTATSNQDQSLETLSHPDFSTFYLDSNTREKKGFDSNLMIKVMRVRKRHLWQRIHSKDHTKLGNLTNYRRPWMICIDLQSKAKFVYVSILVFLTFFTVPHARPRALPARAPRQCKKN